ncbi:hypothetical protein ABIA38_005579 [Embleya sp. AB8]
MTLLCGAGVGPVVGLAFVHGDPPVDRAVAGGDLLPAVAQREFPGGLRAVGAAGDVQEVFGQLPVGVGDLRGRTRSRAHDAGHRARPRAGPVAGCGRILAAEASAHRETRGRAAVEGGARPDHGQHPDPVTAADGCCGFRGPPCPSAVGDPALPGSSKLRWFRATWEGRPVQPEFRCVRKGSARAHRPAVACGLTLTTGLRNAPMRADAAHRRGFTSLPYTVMRRDAAGEPAGDRSGLRAGERACVDLNGIPAAAPPGLVVSGERRSTHQP